MKNVAVLFDGGLSVSKETMEMEGVYHIPTVLVDGEKEYFANVDITYQEFYDQLAEGKLFKTSLPPLDMLEEMFNNLLKEYKEVIYVTLSSELSGTYQSGVLMANSVDEKRIKVFDSLTAIECGELFIKRVAEESQTGKSADEIIQILESIREDHFVLFTVDDIDYLVRGGRIGKAAGAVANFLNIKPILTMDRNGFINTFAKVRNSKKVMAKMIDEFKTLNLDENSRFIIAHSVCTDEKINMVKEKLQENFPGVEIQVTLLSPIIGTHVGRGTFAIAALKL